MPPVGFERAIPASKQLQNHASHYVAIGIGMVKQNIIFDTIIQRSSGRGNSML
jgi:hypothetical protein